MPKYIKNIELASLPVERDNRIDTIRGLLLISMAIDHYGGWVANYIWQPFGYVSDAEGFIFLSGFVFALVYSRYIRDLKLLAKKIFHRAFTVYHYHIYLVFGIPLISLFIPPYQECWSNMIYYLYNVSVVKYVIGSFFMINQPTFMDILPMYTIFIFFCWPILLLLIHGKDYIAIALCIVFWVLGQFINPVWYLSAYILPGSAPGIFNLFSWQIVFFMGAYFGFKKRFKMTLTLLEKPWIKFPLLAVFIFLFLVRYQIIDFNPETMLKFTDRNNLAWLRLINMCVVFFAIYLVLKRIPVKYGIPMVNFLGKHSLQVFAFHILVMYLFIMPLGTGETILEKHGNVLYLIGLVLFLLTLPLPAYMHEVYMKRKALKKIRK
ncbi:MAG: OpgC domain-containing protein [Lentisphaerota bacterium]